MGNRGQKRAEVVEELPADKRACSSLEFKPSSSSSPEQNRMTSTASTQEAQDGDMETSSSTSESQSEGEGERVSRGERGSGYGSCDSDEEDGRLNSLRDRQYQRSSSDRGRLERVLSSLTGGVEQSGQLAALTELCEVLSFSTEDSFSSRMTDTLTPVLVRLSGHESNPDIMLLAIRAITYLCDVHSQSSEYLLRYNAVTALCQRLLAIEYLDVAEQCLQALEKISREQPLHCLQSGAVMAVLTYIDFFSTSVQRVALSTVVNICMNLPSECPSSIMEAVPMLCNLLQYEDRQLVENVATCLILIAERARRSSDMLDELCNHGLVHQATHLISLSSRTTLCQPGLIGLLVKLASGSILACRTLFEHNISSILKDILSTCDLSHGMTSPPVVDGHHNQVHEVLKLLNELLPGVAKDKDTQLALDKEAFLVNQPDLLQKFGVDLLPVLIQVVDSGVNVYVCCGCLSVVNKLVYVCQSDLLLELLKSVNISSFLAGVFTRKDHHVLMLALQIVDNVLQKLCDVFLSSFVKEGVSFAVDALATPERCSQFMFSMFDGIQLSNDPSQKSAARDVPRCLCYAFDTGQSLSASGSRSCQLEKDALHKFATHIRTKYFASNMLDGEKGLTDVLQKLTTLSAALTDLVNMSIEKDSSIQHDEEFYCLLHQIMSHLNEKDPISTFEFVESGIVKSLVNYLSSGQCAREKADMSGAFRLPHIVEKRFEVFGRLLLSSLGVPPEDPPLPALIRKLQSALSSVENYSVVLDHEFKQRNSYVTVPYRHCTKNPCLKVQFVREEGEMCLNDYSSDVLTVDAFSNLDAIEAYLWPKVFRNSAKHVGKKEALPSRTPSSSPPCGSPDIMESGGVSPGVQELEDPVEQEQHASSEEDSSMSVEDPGCNNDYASPKLSFYLEGQKLDRGWTLYQTILQRKDKAGAEIITGPKLWTQARCKYFRLSALGQRQVQSHSSSNGNSGGQNSRSQNTGSLPRKKFLVHRDRILKSAAKMMGLNDSQKVVLEVEYEEEVGTGLGPTLEFYTLVSHEFQKSGLVSKSGGIEFSEVIKKFSLLGQFMAKALQDGRVLDIPFSKAFYKIILGQVVTIYDIQSFDPGLGRALLEFQALVKRKSYLESVRGEKSDIKLESCFRDSTIEDLSLDFVLPGYPDYVFASGQDANMVNMNNLEEYVTYVVDATINSGISRQVEAFKSGFNQLIALLEGDLVTHLLNLQVLPIRHLQIFTEEELERLLCGEREIWNANDLMDHIKFDHGYTARSPPVTNLLEIIREFDCELQKAFLRFVTGAPGLPFGGLASLNPQLTIVRKKLWALHSNSDRQRRFRHPTATRQNHHQQKGCNLAVHEINVAPNVAYLSLRCATTTSPNSKVVTSLIGSGNASRRLPHQPTSTPQASLQIVCCPSPSTSFAGHRVEIKPILLYTPSRRWRFPSRSISPATVAALTPSATAMVLTPSAATIRPDRSPLAARSWPHS
ncbi:hypothetical protein RJ639_030560 [Escallonia herrerae]|uniref:HECT-type E3 ubiquitin transferase n=1 Tax=Escallonia herrerae TaxID=1293975 RepID=A0AA88X366_9ASTE|nr:hypothetical protein RJ639_030560 [Escallonia herrerae]